MLLGKKKKGNSFQVDYIVSVLEIKPWPPTVALCSVQSVLIQWENGEQNSGFLPPGVPSFNGFDDGKIEFNEFFKLAVTLTVKKQGFKKNNLEFHLYEPNKDKAMKGQILGTATINVAEYGIIKEAQTISAAIIMKKVSKGMTQPLLYVQIQPFDNEGIVSVLKMMSEVGDDDSDFISLTTDEDERTSSSSRTPTAFQDRAMSFQIDEMLNFANISLNSDIVGPSEVQPDGRARKSTEMWEKHENKEVMQSGEDSRGSSVKSNSDVFGKFSEVATTRKQTSRSQSALKFGKKSLDFHGLGDKLKHIKSVRLTSDYPLVTGPLTAFQFGDKGKEESSVKEVQVDVKSQEKSEKKEKKSKKDDDDRTKFEGRIEMLEEELREAAAVEIGLYSVAAEHLNSKRKVHAPARRLSRFYRHIHKTGSQAKRASCATSLISGLVVVAKACGNDVPRLTFWLSNAIILRAMVGQITKDIPLSSEPIHNETKSGKKKSEKKSAITDLTDSPDDWEDPQTLTMALEKIEAWIFSRIVEGLWWQSFTPHMQPAKKKKKKGRRPSTRKTQKWRFSLGDQEQGTFSVELWKKAFQDAYERLCPIRAAGHDCGCLPMISKMVMDQLAERLDVAMFNAILRDSDDGMPTDPMSDPISELKVLPIPSGKSSFGAGAQLKNAVKSWSKWLSDFVGPDDNKSSKNDHNDTKDETSFTAFHLLNALGDLMMLPTRILSDFNTRKEVCPIFSGPVIRRVFSNFVPDEFSPNYITKEVLEALDSEDMPDASSDFVKSYPCKANPVVYSPLPTTLFSSMLGGLSNQKTGSSLLRKAHNSDDELDKLNIPLAFIDIQNLRISPSSSKPNWIPRGKGGREVARYQLLHEAWRNGN